MYQSSEVYRILVERAISKSTNNAHLMRRPGESLRFCVTYFGKRGFRLFRERGAQSLKLPGEY